MYENLMNLDLSDNSLTDACFISLSLLSSFAPHLSNIFLNKNRIKLLSISAFKKEGKENVQMSRLSANLRMSMGAPLNQDRQ